MTTAYLAAEGFADQLQEELRRAGAAVTRRHERLFVCDGPAIAAAWAANIWHDCVELPVASIGSAAKALRDIQRNWAMYAPLHHRRAALIQERLPHVSAKPVVFPGRGADRAARVMDPAGARPAAGRGALQLALSPTARWPSSRTRPARPTAPTSSSGRRWCGSAAGRRPGERCLDLGASPGGWTWVLARLGADVIAVDKAPLDPKVAAMPGVEWRGESAFALEPASVGAGRLAVLRHRLLSGAAAAAGRELAGVGPGAEFRLHHQVPGRDRSRRRPRPSRRSRGRGSCICTTTSTS